MSNAPTVSDTRTEFIEKIGTIKQAEGLPRIAGQVFGLLLFDGAAVSFGDLAEDLKVSRGSISSSIRLLEERGLVQRISKQGDRQVYIQLAHNPYARMIEVIRKRSRLVQTEIKRTIDALPENTEAITRLQDYADFHVMIDEAIGFTLTKIMQKQDSQPAQAALKEVQDDS